VGSEIQFLTPWTTPASPEGLVAELRREVGRHHPLFSKAVSAIGVASDRDDVLFEISGGSTRQYAVVHLTWSGKPEPSGTCPFTRFFDSLEQWLEWMKADHEDYTYGEKEPPQRL
jgi:hypothetical protein